MKTKKTIKGVKAFDKNLKCRGFQYKENESFEMDGEPDLCEHGFHFCKNPFDVLNYYNLCDSEFCEVESPKGAKIDKSGDDSKVATTKIKIKSKLGLSGFVNSAVKFLLDITVDKSKNNNNDNSSQLASSGDSSQLASSGDYSKLASSGDSSKLASSGYSSQLASSGDSSQLASSGYSNQLASSGDHSKLALNGKDSVGAAIGINNQIKGKVGCWITLSEYDNNKIKCVKSAKIDGKKIKEDVWYKLKNGKFVMVK